MTAAEAVKVADMEPAEAADLFRTSAKLDQTRSEVEEEILLTLFLKLRARLLPNTTGYHRRSTGVLPTSPSAFTSGVQLKVAPSNPPRGRSLRRHPRSIQSQWPAERRTAQMPA